ncbi:MAG: SdpI family protein [Acidimicrobiia bacterium]|nr:SdpI family protein [Acidimicrobiia bacterium]
MLNYRNAIIVSVVGVLTTIAIALYGWTKTEPGQQVPVHFGINGEADRFGSRFEAFLVFPLVLIGVTVLLAILPRIDPRRTGMEKSVKAYSATWMAVVVFLVAISALITRTAVSGNSTSIEPRVLLIGIGLLFVVLGNYMPKTGSNWFFGFRTPWTLSNEEVWTATHTIGGPILVAVGVLNILAAFALPMEWATGVAIALPLAAIVGLTVYSYLKYRQLSAA